MWTSEGMEGCGVVREFEDSVQVVLTFLQFR